MIKSDWVSAIGTLIGGIAAIGAPLFLYFKKKKKPKDTQIYEALRKDQLLASTITNIKHEFEDVNLVSVMAFTNHTKPVNFQVLYSTDTDTQDLWDDRQPMEPALVTMAYEMMQKGDVRFGPDELHNRKTAAWYEANGVKKSYMYMVGIGEFYLDSDKGKEQAMIALVVNRQDERIMPPDMYIKIHVYLDKVRKIIKEMTVNNRLIF